MTLRQKLEAKLGHAIPRGMAIIHGSVLRLGHNYCAWIDLSRIHKTRLRECCCMYELNRSNEPIYVSGIGPIDAHVAVSRARKQKEGTNA